MKTTIKILNLMILITLATCTTLVLSSSHVKNTSTSGIKTDIDNTIESSSHSSAPATVLTTVEITASRYDNPRYWVNYLESAVQNDFDTNEFSGVLDEMQNNPTYWVDYLKSTEPCE